LLEEIIDGGHRVLVFSQFVKMLDLIKERLIATGTDYCYLAGLTKNRQEEVDRFQNDGAIPVFLVSLKAGGVGLNLSAADTVIHFDPWWNAAVEAQATDRAHRIGQTRVVTSYKLIARATVEEKILHLQQRKRALASAMLENEEPLMTGLTTGELAELLAS
jgi:SNF2 family DNA or RNA helicase